MADEMLYYFLDELFEEAALGLQVEDEFCVLGMGLEGR